LATKHLNKKKLSKSLDNATKNVIKRGVFVVDKGSDGLYSVKNYFNKSVLIGGLPFARTAKSISQWYNKKPEERNEYGAPRLDRVQKDVEVYFKHYNDIKFYEYTMSVTNDDVSFYTAEARCDMSRCYLEDYRQKLFSV